MHIEFDLNYVELILCKENYDTIYTGDHFALALFVGFTVYFNLKHSLCC